MHAAVCDFILDCLQNSVEAGASEVYLAINQTSRNFSVSIKDNGRGMDEDQLKKAVDPFYTDGIKHKSRKVGLGLPFLIQTVEQTGGDFSIESEKNRGTDLVFSLPLDNIDTPPLGDLSAMILQAFMFDGLYDMPVERSLEIEGEVHGYSVKRSEIIEVLGDLNDADSLILARQYLRSQEEDLIQGD